MGIVRKSVAFNDADPDQVKLLEHAELRPNFSGYVKRLIQRDMEGGMSPGTSLPEKEETPAKGLMQGLI